MKDIWVCTHEHCLVVHNTDKPCPLCLAIEKTEELEGKIERLKDRLEEE